MYILSAMACLSNLERENLIAELQTINEQLENANTALTSALTNSEVEEYRFNSGEGSQSTKRRSLKEINEVIENLQSRRDKIIRKLNGKSLINLNLRRKSYNRGLYYRGPY